LVHDAGDHELVIGRVNDLGVGEGSPLLFYKSDLSVIVAAEPGAAATGSLPPAATEKDGT
jgi:flavin reductase (DIM6/NTAB) family NADH-FMN oxidoreductase RutF